MSKISRSHRFGSIYKRLSGLIEGKVIRKEDAPIWYDIYIRFPPRLEPDYYRPAPDVEIKPIVYEEDKIRAKCHKHLTKVHFDLNDDGKKTESKAYIKKCQNILKEKQSITIDEALANIFQSQRKLRKENPSAEEQ